MRRVLKGSLAYGALAGLVFGMGGLSVAKAAGVGQKSDGPALTTYVNLFVGTQNADVRALDPVPAGERGGTFPGATLPFGMIQWTPMTPSDGGKDHPVGYVFTEDQITGFPVTQMSGAGCDGNSGELPILPVLGNDLSPAKFSHAQEIASPGFYKVRFDNGIETELTVTARTGHGRFTFPNTGVAGLLIDPSRTNTYPKGTDGALHLEGARALSGFTRGGNFCGAPSYNLYFYVEFNRDIDAKATTIGENGKTVVRFSGENQPLQMKVGISYVSIDGAKKNLKAENAGWALDAVKQKAQKAWEERLLDVKVTGGSTDDKRKFYTALYHSLLSPNINSDVDGRYIGFDQKIHKSTRGTGHYANYSNWDTYRSQMPLIALLYPREVSHMMQTLVDDADICGGIPRWSPINVDQGIMPGDSGVPVVTGAYAFGAKAFDAKRALYHMKTVGNRVVGRCGNTILRDGDDRMADHLKRGYVSVQRGWWAGSLTHEFATVDFSIAYFAKSLGDEAGYRQFLTRSAQWKNVFDEDRKGLIPRKDNGSYLSNPKANEHMVEGNAEQYTWMLTHDTKGLFGMMGSDDYVIGRLDKYFSNLNAGMSPPHFYIGNEPSFASPWLYNWTSKPWKTQEVVRTIMIGDAARNIAPVFNDTPGGLPGNDDLGAVSSWYVWSAIGLFPALPAVPGLAVNAPLFDKVELRYGDGKKTLVIQSRCEGQQPCSSQKPFIKGLKVDGRSVHRGWLDLGADLKGHSNLQFDMAASPSDWGKTGSHAMPSFGLRGYHSLKDAFNARGFWPKGRAISQKAEGNSFDLMGKSFVADQKAQKDLGITQDRFGFDHMIVQGQEFEFAKPKQVSQIVLLGAGTLHPTASDLLITYEDGKTETLTFGFQDWSDGVAQSSVNLGQRLDLEGRVEKGTAALYERVLQPTHKARIVRLKFSESPTGGRMHIFKMDLNP